MNSYIKIYNIGPSHNVKWHQNMQGQRPSRIHSCYISSSTGQQQTLVRELSVQRKKKVIKFWQGPRVGRWQRRPRLLGPCRRKCLTEACLPSRNMKYEAGFPKKSITRGCLVNRHFLPFVFCSGRFNKGGWQVSFFLKARKYNKRQKKISDRLNDTCNF